jgi:hypothetical protein
MLDPKYWSEDKFTYNPSHEVGYMPKWAWRSSILWIEDLPLSGFE